MTDSRDVPANGGVTEEMHQIERVHEMMEVQDENEKLLSHSPDDGTETTTQTVATNTTK